MYKVVLVLVWLKEVKEVVVVTVDGLPPEPGNGVCNRGDGLPPVSGTPSQQSRSQGSGMDGQTPEVSTMPQQQQPQQQQANVSQNVQGCASTTNLDANGQGYPVQGCQQGNMLVMQGQGPAWFGAQWIPQQQQTFMQQNAQARVPSFGCASMPGGPRSGSFPNLGVNLGIAKETCRVAQLERVWEV